MKSAIRVEQRETSRGFTLLEAMISLTVLSILIATMFTMAVGVSDFAGDTDADYSVITELNMGFLRLGEVMRKTGWVSVGGVSYPRTLSAGTQLEFRMLQDLDGNGYAFDAATGDLEWSPKVFSVRLDNTTQVLAVYEGTKLLWTLGHHIIAANFATYIEDASLQLKEVQLTLTAQRQAKNGSPITLTNRGSIIMRN